MIWSPKLPESSSLPSLPSKNSRNRQKHLKEIFASRAILRKVAKLIKKGRKILIIIHEVPDGDAIGSALALSYGLEKLGKQVSVICKDKPAPIFNFLAGISKIRALEQLGQIEKQNFDTLILLDCGDLNRTGFPQYIHRFSKGDGKVINIDHHPQNNLHPLANYNFCNSDCASTAQLVYQLLLTLKIKIDKRLSTYILTAIYTDTGGFMHPNISKEVMLLASEMMKRGARTKAISGGLRLSRSVTDLQLWGVVFSRLNFNKKYKIAFSYVLKKDFDSYGSQPENLAGAVNLIGVIPQAKVSLLFYEVESGTIKGSIRTQEDSINVSRLASYFGGGGHPKASGFKIAGKFALGKRLRIILSE